MESLTFYNQIRDIVTGELSDYELEITQNSYRYSNVQTGEEYVIIPKWRINHYIKEWLEVGNIAFVDCSILGRAIGIHYDVLLEMNRKLDIDKLTDILMESIKERKEEIFTSIAVSMIKENRLERYLSCDGNEDTIELFGKACLVYKIDL